MEGKLKIIAALQLELYSGHVSLYFTTRRDLMCHDLLTRSFSNGQGGLRSAHLLCCAKSRTETRVQRCASLRKRDARHLWRRQPSASAPAPRKGASGQALTTELAVVGSEEVIDRGSKAAAWSGLAALSFTLLGIAGGHGRDLVPPVPAHGSWGCRSRVR